MFYFLILFISFPIRFLFAPRKVKTNSNLIIQTAKIGDYVNASCLFEALSTSDFHLDLVIDKSVEPLVANDPRVRTHYIINYFKKSIFWKIRLGFLLLKQSYDQVIVLLPNQLNLFLGSFSMSVYKATLVPYQLSASSKVLTCDYHRLVSHSKNNLTIKSYSKCIRNFNGEYFSKSLIISREKVFDEYSFANKKYAGVVLTSGSNWKNIPPIEWSWVFHTLTELDFEIVVIGTDSDGDILKKIVSNSQKNVTNLINRIPLADLPALISKFLVLIGSDTGPIYIADSIGVPTVVYAGPCHMTEQCPVGETFIVESTVEPKNKSYVFDTLKSGDFTDHYITNKNVRRDIFQFLANL